MNEFQKRTLTGVLFAIFILLAVWWNIFSLTLLLVIVMTLALIELLNLQDFPRNLFCRILCILSGVSILLTTAYYGAVQRPAPSALFLLPFGFFLITHIMIRIRTSSRTAVYTWLFAALYIILPLSIVPLLAYIPAGSEYQSDLIISVLLIIWTYDSFAYLTGVSIGKRRMFPSISPKKSWEGFFGGIFFALLAAYLVSLRNTDFTPNQWLGMAVLISLAGTTGDFFQSHLKRKAGVKDTGKWLPGHGGILDRFDSFLFVVPVVFLYVKLITIN